MSIFLISILLCAVGSTGSLYSINILSNKTQTGSESRLFSNVLNSNMAWAEKKNCESQEESETVLEEILNRTGITKEHPEMGFEKNNDKKLEIKNKNTNSTEMVNVHSPFGKLIQEKQHGNPNRENITVNCHKLLMVKEHPNNGTHNKFEIETFTSVKIKPNDGTKGNPNNEQEGWGDVIVKNNSTNKSPDLGLNLTNFATAEVFLDSNTNSNYDVGEFIYSNSASSTVNTGHIRQFDDYNFNLEVNVKNTDDDFGKSPLINFNSTVLYYDDNGDSVFSANETVYLDFEPFGIISDNDIRLANARFVGDIEDSSSWYMDGVKANVPNTSEGFMKFNSFIDECNKNKMGTYNHTSDTCDYTKKFGKHMEDGLKTKGFDVKFKNKGPDLNRKLEIFVDEVWVDSDSSGDFSVGDKIYRHLSPSNKLAIDDIRIANHGSNDGSLISAGDPDVGKSFFEFSSTEKYYDENDNNLLDVGETIYQDTKAPFERVTAGDKRLVNAKTVGEEFEDDSEVYKKAKFEDMTENGKGMGMGRGDDIEIGMEERQFNFTENLILTVASNSTNSTTSFDSILSSFAAPFAFDGIVAEEDVIKRNVTKDILFGDTVVPHVRFGFDINIESCFWIFGCITWFQVAVFFTPYLMTGFRLPGRVKAYDVPDREFASKSFDVTSDFETYDASYADYEAICESDDNTLKTGGYFGPSTPFTCKDFASYDAMSIPSVLKTIASDLETTFLAAASDPTNSAKQQKALGDFLKVGKILFDPLPPTGIDKLVKRITDSKLTTANEASVKTLIQGQEVVLKAGVIIEVKLVILDIELLDINEKVEVDLLGVVEGVLLYNEIVESSNPTVYNAEYAKQSNPNCGEDNQPKCVPGPKADYKKIWELISDYDKLKEKDIVFTSFKAPFGFNEDGEIESFPFLNATGVPVLSNTGKGYNILYLRGNCLGAYLDGQILKIPAPYGPLPLCTTLYQVGFAEAILGIKSNIGSVRVDASMLPQGDAQPMPNQGVYGCDDTFPDTDDPTWRKMSYCAYLDDQDTGGTKSSNVTRTITVDNFDPTTDDAKIKIDNFIYNLQWITIGDLLINFENPVKFFLPTDIHELKINLFTKAFTLIDIPQHPRVAGLTGTDVRVFNYAVGISNDEDPISQPNGTKPIRSEDFELKPQLRSNSTVSYENIGNSLDNIHNLKIEFPDVSPENTNIPWMSVPNQTQLNGIEFNLTASSIGQQVFGINPPRHWSTAPSYLPDVGLYDVTVYASSSNATKHGMPPIDPLNNYRINATDVLKINVTQFGAPDLNFTEAITQTKPGGITHYNAKISNFGNGNDTIALTQQFVDSNIANCDLFSKGPDNPNCPYRAEYTVLQDSWTNSTNLCNLFWQGTLPCDDIIPDPALPLIPPNESDVGYNDDYGVQQNRQYGLHPADFREQGFITTIPGNWAGVDDTLYLLNGTVISTVEKEEIDTKFVEHTVIATKESSIRYVGLEISTMKQKVTAADIPEKIDKGSKNALTQILDKAIESSNERALEIVCENNSRAGPNNALRTSQQQLEGFVKAIKGMSPSNIRVEFADELISNANETIKDIDKAMENEKSSIVPCAENFSLMGGKIRTAVSPLDNQTTEKTAIDDPIPTDPITNSGADDTNNSGNESAVETPKESFKVDGPPVQKQPQQITPESKNKVPLWIKSNARWWADNQIADSDFILGIQYLIQEKLIIVDSTSEKSGNNSDPNIPDWIRNNANWWAEDLISEDEMISAFEFLINEGIIKLK